MLIGKDVDRTMRIEGTRQELDWVWRQLQNHCACCPYQEHCETRARKDVLETGGVLMSCGEYLNTRIEFVVMEE